MATIYKLTDQDGYTRRGRDNETLWKVGKTVTVDGDGTRLCTSDVLHGYADPLVAVFMNPLHADIDDPRMFICEGEIVADDNGLKSGAKSLTVLREIAPPVMTTEQRVRAAILVALKVYNNPDFVRWAKDWLDGTNRNAAAARAIAWAAEAEETWAAAAAAAVAQTAARAAARVAKMVDIPSILQEVMSE